MAPSTGEAEPRSSSAVEAAVKATTAEASVRDAERADADVVMEEVPSAAGPEAVQPGGPQPQQNPSAEPAAMVEGGGVEPPPEAPEEEVPTVEAPAPEVPAVEAPVPEVPAVEGPAPEVPVTVDLTLDDSPLDKGKQVVRVEGGEAVDQAGASTVVGKAGAAGEAGPSAGPEDALAGSLSSWPDRDTAVGGSVPPVQGRYEP